MEISDKIKQLINEALESLDIKDVDFVVEHPEDLKNGDYSTNVAMAGAKQLKSNPRELAQKVLEELNKILPKEIEKVEIAGAGFINFYLAPKFFRGSVEEILNNPGFAENKSLKNK